MALEGMDVDLANTQLGQLQTQGIDKVVAVIQQMSALIDQIANNWKGPDASQFHNDWMGNLVPQLNTVQTALQDFHTRFNQNIQEQVSASA